MNGITYTDPDFGTLTWDSKACEWVGCLCTAELRVAGSARYMEVSDLARQTFLRLNGSDMTARRYAASKLLSLYNTEWRRGPQIEAEAFIERIALEGVAIDDDGSASFSYLDGDLFAGHYVVVNSEPNGEFFDAILCG